jgi:hypothetical protein
MGGGITVTSEVGRGSCFSVRILANCADERAAAGAASDNSASVATPAFAL